MSDVQSIVVAKVKGYPYWPALLLPDNRGSSIHVYFFGTHRRAYVSAKNCFELIGNFEKLPLKESIIQLQVALSEAHGSIANDFDRLIFAEACEEIGIIPALHKPLEENMMSLFRVQKKSDLPRVREASEETVEKGKGGGKHTHTRTLVGKGQAAVLLPSSSSLSSANGLLSLLTVPTPGIPSDSIGHPLAALPKPLLLGKELKWEIETILQWRSVKKCGQPLHEALVKWSGFGHACNTWEPLRNIPAWFHRTPNEQDPKALSKEEQGGVHENVRAVGESSKKTLRGKRRRVSDSGEWLKTECARRESMRKESYILWPQQYSSSEEEEAGEQVYQVDEKERARAKERAQEAQVEEEKQQNEGLRILFAENSRSATEFLGKSRDSG
mmetsp:Transcript_30349/g.44330  ORF Transcript_30349/g.44330 Transcript_30349/m.44330 type:complete len:385 (-) Transcript_30349:124-1278(-)